jgi:hypothetical protein
MYSALVDGCPILASKSLDPRREYFCPRCNERVALKTGLYVAPHFAHYPKSDCPRRGGGESKEHASLKVQLYKLLWPQVERGRISNLRIEAPFGEMVSDLGFTTPKGLQVAVEITVNNLNFDHFCEKITAYRQMKVYPLWLFARTVLKPKSKQTLTPEKIMAAMQAETADWVELEGLYRAPRVLVYLHSFLGRAFLVLPDGLPVLIRLVKPEGMPTKRRSHRKVQVLPKPCYPLTLELLVSRYDGGKFPRPVKTPMAVFSSQLENFGSYLFGGSDGGNLSQKTILVSERTGIRFNFPSLKNADIESTYSS